MNWKSKVLVASPTYYGLKIYWSPLWVSVSPSPKWCKSPLTILQSQILKVPHQSKFPCVVMSRIGNSLGGGGDSFFLGAWPHCLLPPWSTGFSQGLLLSKVSVYICFLSHIKHITHKHTHSQRSRSVSASEEEEGKIDITSQELLRTFHTATRIYCTHQHHSSCVPWGVGMGMGMSFLGQS